MDGAETPVTGYRGRGLRPGQLMALAGLTGFAISQPLLSIAGQNPTSFTFAGVSGSKLVVFAALVALVPPLVLWLVVVLAGRVDRRAGDLVFVVSAALLVGATTIQVMKAVDIERGILHWAGALIAAAVFTVALVRLPAAAMWVRYTAPLPILAVVLFLGASPTAALLRPPSAAAARTGSSLPSVVIIMLDEFPTQSMLHPDGGIDAERFPNLAAFQQESTWYRSYTAQAGTTSISVPSMLSGQNPRLVPPLWPEYPDSLFTLLAPTHDLSVSETSTLLCGYTDCGVEGDKTVTEDRGGLRSVVSDMAEVWRSRVTPGRFDEVDMGQFTEEPVLTDPPGLDDRSRGLGGMDDVRALPRRVVNFMASLGPGPRPTLSYLHVLLPHQPWSRHPDGSEHTMAGEKDDRLMAGEEWTRAVDEQTHLLQVQYTDRVVGEVLDRLRETGIYDESVIVITADHGISFGEAPYRWLREDNLPQLAHVPLMVKGAHRTEARVDDSNLWGTDFLPLLAAEVGVEIDFPVEGHEPHSEAIRARGDRKVFYDFGNLWRDFKGIREFDGSGHPNTDHRLVGPLAAPDNPVSGLVARLGVEDRLGTSVDQLGPSPGGEVEVWGLDRVLDPPDDGAVLGLFWGRVSGIDAGPDPVALVALDDVVVSASPLGPNGEIEVLLPPGVQDPDGSTLRVVVLDEDRVIEPEVTAGG